jgi:MOSC domain-containing protein YiiM
MAGLALILKLRTSELIRVGSCRLQLSEPGQPDEWHYARPRKSIVEAAKRKNRTGWYYRIIDPGWVTAGDAVVGDER